MKKQPVDLPFRSYNAFLRQHFGERVHKISINAGFTCPNRDGSLGTGGCTYCNIGSFTPPSSRARFTIREQIATGIEKVSRYVKANKFIAYFQPYTNTYGSTAELEQTYRAALEHPQIVGLAVGTRPDCIDDDTLRLLQDIAQDYFVALEYGIESIYDETLARVNRGHTFAQTVAAIERSQGRNLHITGHVVLGFPNESRRQYLQMAPVISRLGISGLKIHNLHIVKHTELARQYREAPFHIFNYAEWVDLVIEFLERLAPEIFIERLFGEAPRDYRIAPQWSLSKAEIYQGIIAEMRRRGAFQGRLYPDEAGQYPVTGAVLSRAAASE